MSIKWKTKYSEEEVEWVKSCPLCGSQEYFKYAEEWTLGILCCSLCGLIYVNPRIRDHEKNYWGEEKDALHKYGPIFDGSRPHDRDRNYREHLRVIEAFKPAGNFLDVGTHCGFFLRIAAKKSQWALYGIEPSLANAKLARDKFNLDVRTGYLEEDSFPSEYFDVVTLIDVLEHVADPLKLLNVIWKILKPGGILFVKVPNARWNQLKYQVLVKMLKTKSFDIFDSREHVIHFSQETLVKTLSKARFEIKNLYLPLPIQSGTWWKKAGRLVAHAIARVEFFCFGTLGYFATDLACVATKPN